MSDRRKLCRAEPPFTKGSKPVTVVLGPDDYRALYEATMQRGTSMQETIRQIIREMANV